VTTAFGKQVLFSFSTLWFQVPVSVTPNLPRIRLRLSTSAGRRD
jgi:hypothetical protein